MNLLTLALEISTLKPISDDIEELFKKRWHQQSGNQKEVLILK